MRRFNKLIIVSNRTNLSFARSPCIYRLNQSRSITEKSTVASTPGNDNIDTSERINITTKFDDFHNFNLGNTQNSKEETLKTLYESDNRNIKFDSNFLESVSVSINNTENENIEQLEDDLSNVDDGSSGYQRSEKALKGSSDLGMYTMSNELRKAWFDILRESDKRFLKLDLKRLDMAMFSTGIGKSKPQENPIEPHILRWGPRESIAYLLARFPHTLTALNSVLRQISHRIPDFQPKTILDYGIGPGTSIWEATSIWKSIKEVHGVDISEAMLSMTENIRSKLPADESNSYRLYLRRYLSHHHNKEKVDLAISAFTLEELPTDAMRDATILSLWNSTNDILVLIDRGDPEGFRRIAHARNMILTLENDKLYNRAKKGHISLDKVSKAHVVAPCPHDGQCPMLKSTKTWCSFHQRFQKESFEMRLRRSKLNTDEASYSYVVLRKGERVDYEENTWRRITSTPLKRDKHVVMDTCSPSGELERFVVSKKSGKQFYYDARKSKQHDLWPYEPTGTIINKSEPQGVVDKSAAIDDNK